MSERKDPDVFILRFEKWAGKNRRIKKNKASEGENKDESPVDESSWNWNGRPAHRNLTMSAALEHEQLKKRNFDDNAALSDVEESFNTLQKILTSSEGNSSSPTIRLMSNTSSHSNQSIPPATEVSLEEDDSAEIADLFQYRSASKRKKIVTPSPPVVVSSRLYDPNYIKLQTLRLQNQAEEGLAELRQRAGSRNGHTKVK